MRKKCWIQLICMGGVVLSTVAVAQDDLKQRVDDLEQELHTLRESLSDSRDGISKWVDRVRISGNADITYMNGEENSRSSESQFEVDNTRLFFDFDLSDSTSFYAEWDIARGGEQRNEFGQLYLRLDHLFGVDPLNVKAGSMPIPFGEEYLRFHEQRFENPLISFSAPAPYNWDEGIEMFGGLMGNRVEYVVAVMDGDDDFGKNSQEEVQIVGRFTIHPTAWSRLVFSALNSGGLGTADEPGISALEFGGSHAYTIHGIGDVPNFQNGEPLPDDPSTTLTLTAWEIDTIASHGEWGRVWAAYGSADIDSDGPSSYDRQLQYWIAEGIVEFDHFSNYFKRSERYWRRSSGRCGPDCRVSRYPG